MSTSMHTCAPVYRAVIVIAVASAVLVALLLSGRAAEAGDKYAGSPYARWFSELKNGEGQFCCGDYDGVRYALPYRINGDGSATLARTEEVPASRVVPPNPTGQPLLWREPGGAVRCFSPGAAF